MTKISKAIFTFKTFFVLLVLIASFLRLWRLDEVPVSMFGDELDVGYHAYSILKTGRDYSGNFMPLHFQSLAEWRTPLYLYSAVPTVFAFGISPYGVRLPAAIFGVLSIIGAYLLVKVLFENKKLAFIAVFVLTFSPWHIQYSRAAFEVTMLLSFLFFGLYFYFYSLKNNGNKLWLSVTLLTLTPLIYSTAKFFTPFLLIFLFILWFKELKRFSRKILLIATVCLVFFSFPTIYSTVFGGGAQRFAYISIFTDPTLEPEVGTSRMTDAYDRKALVDGLVPSFYDKFFHNKIVIWASTITKNLLMSYSTDFLFISGDPNLRHSVKGIGQFYQVEMLALIIGIISFFALSNLNLRIKILICFMLLFGAIPASLTRDGGNHATRLIIILLPLVILISFGIDKLLTIKNINLRRIVVFSYTLLFAISFIYFQHTFWVHNKYDSERWWHFGFDKAISLVKENENKYDKVIISMYGEPAWIFFAALYPYDPVKWHEGYPFKDKSLDGFGKISFIDKYYFGSPQNAGLYDWGKVLPVNSLYLASEKEVKVNLIREPERTPGDLTLIDYVAYPSGEPAFYLFARR